MFSLIIVVISIALITALILATMYYGGGDSLTQGNNEAIAAEGVNQINQIRAATFTYHAMRGQWPETLDELVPDYMGSLPIGWGGGDAEAGGAAMSSRMIPLSNDPERSERICEIVNERLKLNLTVAPSCDSISPGFAGCCLSD